MLIALSVVGLFAAADSPELVIEKAVMKTAAQVDRCVAAYTAQRPEVKGMATVTAQYKKSGQVKKVEVGADVPESQNLGTCLRKVAFGWTLPELTKDGESLTVRIPVFDGAKLDLAKARAKAQANAERRKDWEKDHPSGYFTFEPGAFLDNGWTGNRPGTGVPPEDPGTGVPPEEAAATDDNTGVAPSDQPATGPNTGTKPEGSTQGQKPSAQPASGIEQGTAPEDPGTGVPPDEAGIDG